MIALVVCWKVFVLFKAMGFSSCDSESAEDGSVISPSAVGTEEAQPSIARLCCAWPRKASERFFTLEDLGLHLVGAQLELPALVVERGEIFGRILCAVGQEGHQYLRLESAALLLNCTSDPLRGKARIVAASFRRNLQFNEVVAVPNP